MKLALFMNKLGVTESNFKVDVYRDGEVVTLVAKGKSVRETDKGKIVTNGVITQQYETVAAFEDDRDKLFNRFPLAYTKIVGRLGIDDNVKKALQLPENLRHLLPEYAKVLPEKTNETNDSAEVVVNTGNGQTEVIVKESKGRPFLI